MPTQDTLEFLKDHFRQAELESEIVELDDDSKQRRLLVYLGTDQHERGVTMQVTAQELALGGELFTAATDKHAFVRLQFDVPYAFAVKDEALLDVAQFLHFLNLQIELPGFYLDQLDNRILYRYVWLCKRGKVYPQLATNIVGMAMFFQGAFESVLDRLASGQETYLSLLEELMRTLNKGGGV